ncbi:hypothetical protein [Dyadobacter sp. CY326]|uniref:hypothetical protein n=1 Tax=Dyadobacter sp. CY326 TaxID=2907300 RepID=UPI001F3F7660|nr:hypothetical protein [Dyadobacter sp. CY326]MCE7063641.1 hypothetical protein [Dyadobacter sp. CY326]
MKKLIFCALVIFMGACKDKDDDVAPEVDYAPEYVGAYATTTINGPTTVNEDWTITVLGKNKLAIAYIRTIKIAIAGTSVTVVQEYPLSDVHSDKDGFTINETVNVKQSTGEPLKHKVEGVATRVAGASGVAQLNINLKIADPSNGKASYEGYLEFKKK